MKSLYLAVITVLFLAGCSASKHIDELVTLKRLSNEQAEIKDYIDERDHNFEKMLKEVQGDHWDGYKNMKMIVAAFGEPIFKKTEEKDSEVLDVWGYRYQTQYFDSKKIYIYFNQGGDIVDTQWVRSPGEK